jgi:hypothetical protein
MKSTISFVNKGAVLSPELYSAGCLYSYMNEGGSIPNAYFNLLITNLIPFITLAVTALILLGLKFKKKIPWKDFKKTLVFTFVFIIFN